MARLEGNWQRRDSERRAARASVWSRHGFCEVHTMTSAPSSSASASAATGSLRDVVAAPTSICTIDGQAGKLIYRGYSIEDLAAQSTYEETVWLLWHGELP